VLVENWTGYKNLCSLLTQAICGAKRKLSGGMKELPEFSAGLIALLGSARDSRAPSGDSPDGSMAPGACAKKFPASPDAPALRPRNLADRAQRCSKLWTRSRYVEYCSAISSGSEERINRHLIELAEHHRLPLLATNGVQHATLSRPRSARRFYLHPRTHPS
jgi:DNA polymerase III alpha subunit